MAEILKGAPVAAALSEAISRDVEELKAKGIDPALAIVRIGERPDDLAYERSAMKRAGKVGVEVRNEVFPESIVQDEFFAELDRINKDIYRDAMALDTENIADGATTATQIRAAYENLNSKTDKFEYQVLDFLEGIMAVAGVDDEASFTRSQIINQTESIEILIQAAPYLSEDYVTQKILEILGDGDKAEQMLEDIDEDDMSRITTEEEPAEEEPIEE